MLRLTYFPLKWKSAQIIMIHKLGKPPTRVTSYRPISLLPILSKIFERLFLKRLHKVANIDQKIPTHQFGFRENHSTIQQCHRIVHGILQSLEEKKLCTAGFLDIQQTFDRVWHDGLLYKLKQFLPTPHYLLLQSYLSDRYSQKNSTRKPPHTSQSIQEYLREAYSVLSSICYSLPTYQLDKTPSLSPLRTILLSLPVTRTPT